MTLKAKMVLFFILSLILTAGFMALLAVAYINDFQILFSLLLLGATVATMIFWCCYYMFRTKYKDSLNPKKNKYIKKGNRKESRKAVNRVKK